VVIDATGRRATHARRSGARLVSRDRLTAAVAVYAGGAGAAVTTVEAVEHGWWYTCPIPGGRQVTTFLTDGDLLDPELRSSAGFDRWLRRTEHISAEVGVGVPTRPLVLAAGTAHLDRPVGTGWLAAGDAAASFDPLSSQGILTAVLMGREAARTVDDPHDYAGRYRTIIDRYLAEQRAMYRREQRWPDAPFWARRHA